jgi:hypothetical protein
MLVVEQKKKTCRLHRHITAKKEKGRKKVDGKAQTKEW